MGFKKRTGHNEVIITRRIMKNRNMLKNLVESDKIQWLQQNHVYLDHSILGQLA